MDEAKFRQKIELMTDPYYDREFFTNLVYCMDRKKSLRDIFEGVLQEFSVTPEFNDVLDKTLLNLFYSHNKALHHDSQFLSVANKPW